MSQYAKVLNCRFQEMYALSFMPPSMLSILRCVTIVSYIASYLL